jgi:hypothetical protein
MPIEAKLVKPERMSALMGEAREVVSLVVASIRTARRRARLYCRKVLACLI